MTCAYEQDITAAYFDALGCRSTFQILDRDGIARLQKGHTLVARHIEQHTTPNDLILRFVDTVFGGTAASHQSSVVAVVHLSRIEDVRQAVPLRDALQGHDDPVVRATIPLQFDDFLVRFGLIAAVTEHRVDGVKA